MEKMNWKKVVLFISLTFVINWLIGFLFFAIGGKWNTPAALPVGIGYMFVPMIVAIVVQKVIYRQPLKFPLGISWRINRWWFVAWLLPPLIAFAAAGISPLIPGVTYAGDTSVLFDRLGGTFTPEQLEQMRSSLTGSLFQYVLISLAQGLFFGVTINAIAGFGEELGWRGFMQNELAPLGFWKSSALIGVIWGIWHAPLILQGHNYPQHPQWGVLMMTLFCLLYGTIISFIRIKARSVIAAAIMHGTLNGTAGLTLLLIKGGNDLLIGVTGATGFIVLIVVNVAIFLFMKYSRKKEPEITVLATS